MKKQENKKFTKRDGSVAPAEYQIYALPIEITDTLYVDLSQRGKHYGTYYSLTVAAAPDELTTRLGS